MLYANQNTNPSLKSKMRAVFPIPRGIIFLAGLILGWGVLNISGALKPTSFYSFSNLASVIESFGTLFTSDDGLAIVSSAGSLQDGDLFTITFERANTSGAEGDYSLSYPCVSGFTLAHVRSSGTEDLACGEKASLGKADLTSVTLKATLTGKESLDVPITIYFKGAGRDAEKALYAQTLITVVNTNGSKALGAGEPASTTKASSNGSNGSNGNGAKPLAVVPGSQKAPLGNKPPTSTGNYNGTIATGGGNPPAPVLLPGGSASSTFTVAGSGQKPGVKTEKTFVYYSTGPTPSNANGAIDLEARILEVGVIDKDTGVFTASSSPSANLRIAVRFEVVNKGTKVSGSWRFNAVLPTMPFYIYFGDTQLPLMPGEKIEFTIGFDSIERKKEGEFVVNVDPTNSVVESDKSNNIVKVVLNPYF